MYWCVDLPKLQHVKIWKTLEIGGALSYKKDRDAGQKFRKESLRGTVEPR